MQILTSGSFINLENQEKIEQLIFTAQAIADSAVETDGFMSSEENNKRLALEIWQGAEYLTREHEKARIQNLFTNNFLERLREIAPAQAANPSPENIESSIAETAPVETDVPRDEFLGFVTATAENENQETVEASDDTANAERSESVEILSPTDEAVPSVQAKNSATETANSVENLTEETPEIKGIETETGESVEPGAKTKNEISGASENTNEEKPAIGAITLSDKEPYRWDDCTVTATMQLLPTETGKRRVVLSVRTHDFAPQISVVEFGGTATPEQIAPALLQVFERYKTDLPVKVMDKMKREKSAGKKHQSKQAHDPKSSPSTANSSVGKPMQAAPKSVETGGLKPEVNQTATNAAVAATPPAASQATIANRSKTSVKTSKPEISAQGNLFGF